MPNEVKYANLNWHSGVPVAGERLATNGHYTGQHKGTPLQDAKAGGVQGANTVEASTVRYGTILGDAADTKTFPTKA